MNSLLIHRNVTAFLQSLRDYVNHGYTYWTSGTIKTLKAEPLSVKFNERYGVLAPRQKRDYNRKLGRANSYLLMYPQVGGDIIDWILIATKGEGSVHCDEKLFSHHSGRHTERIHWRHYEVVKMNGRLTWRLRPDVLIEWEKKIVSAARKKDIFDLQQVVNVLYHFPMFTGVRKQVWSLLQKAYKTRQRHHHSDQVISRTLPIMKRIKIYDTPPNTLGKLVDAYRARLANYKFNNE
ncbi:MAG: hypothetical protein ABI296_04875 [Gammaproteobacteria bacterium]